MTLSVLTFGCRLNAYESEAMRALATAAGVQDAIIVNSCAVTGEAERQARQAIRKARRAHPEKRVIVTGCAAQTHPETFAAMPEVDVVMGNAEKMQEEIWEKVASYELRAAQANEGESGALSPSLVTRNSQPVTSYVSDIMAVRETASHLVAGFEGKARAFVQAQNGCDHRCTFCVIPFGRGPSRSATIGEVTRQTRALVENGYKEIVFSGVDLTDYGKGLPGAPTLGALVRRVLKAVPELPRLRLSSVDAAEIDADLRRALAEEERLMPHLHLSAQSGDDMILKRMKRRHSRRDVLALCAEARALRPGVVFGADFIAGFPTETEAMFENTLSLVEEAGITYLHVFPYSARQGTPAAKMPQVPLPVRKERARRLRALGERQTARFLRSRLGSVASVLVEKEGMGRTEHYAPVATHPSLTPGNIYSLRLREAGADAPERDCAFLTLPSTPASRRA